ncbi:MAG TPA: M20 family metallopeptidase [Gemmatimonadales bacterium]|nr:M20 family metallopeptidase [Gemmatimonadales bacterium]
MSDVRKAPLADLFSADEQHALVELRHDLHRRPELSSAEHRTASRLEQALAPLHPKALTRVAGTGVVARIAGTDPSAPTVALRGDIDALPIQEDTGLPFSSEVSGVMHACGHDVHATWVVGAAMLLTRRPATGDVVILLQPAEETGRGALAMIEGGALDGVRAIFAGHVDRRFVVGQVVADAGPVAAAADTFEVELLGSGAHGARPHEARDPIVAAGTLITALQTIVSRRLNPSTPAVVSLGSVHGGTAPNVIPGAVTLTGTLRATDPATRALLHGEVERIAAGVAAAHGLEVRVAIEQGPPPVVNPAESIVWARKAASTLLGAGSLVPFGIVNLAGEDFAWYLEKVPGCFLRIGAREPNGAVIPAHSPKFFAADEAIFVGAAVLAETARVAARELHER